MTTMNFRLLTPAILCMLAPFIAFAAETPSEKSFRSFTSSISCEQAVKSLGKKEGLSDFALLVSAFVTGTNYAKGRDSHADLKGMMMLTEKYCRDNPKQPVTTALVVLDKALDQQLAKQAKPAAPAGN